MSDAAILPIFVIMFFALAGWWNAVKGILYVCGGIALFIGLAIMSRPKKPSNKDPPAGMGR